MTTTPTPDPLETILDEWLVHDLECQSNLTDDIKDCTCIAKDIKRNLMPALTAHIKTVCEAVIGKDETHWTDHFGHESNVPTDGMNARNNLRAEQRTRLQSLTKEEEKE